METENWINEVLNSTNGMMKVVPDDSLFSQIENRIQFRANGYGLQQLHLLFYFH